MEEEWTGLATQDSVFAGASFLDMGVNLTKPIEFSPHARGKMLDRGATESEVKAAIRTGSPEPARKRRLMLRKNLVFNSQWRGKHYAIKQVAPVVAEEADRLVVVTVFVYYF